MNKETYLHILYLHLFYSKATVESLISSQDLITFDRLYSDNKLYPDIAVSSHGIANGKRYPTPF
jgi:hypothetical protein